MFYGMAYILYHGEYFYGVCLVCSGAHGCVIQGFNTIKVLLMADSDIKYLVVEIALL